MRVVGIQGGRGSFNDSAIRQFQARTGEHLDVQYRFTTEGVLEALDAGAVELGQFAVVNSAAGIYDESLDAMAGHVFTIVDRYEMAITHSLMIRPDVSADAIDTILTHAQVVKQCRRSIESRWGHLEVEIGSGALADPSQVAAALASGRLPGTFAVLSNPLLAELHGLQVLEPHMEDVRENASTFLLVARRAPRRPVL